MVGNPESKARESNPRAIQTRLKSLSPGRYRGQAAHDMRRGPQPGYVDTERAAKNSVLIPVPPFAQMRRICEERRDQRRTKRAMRSDVSPAVSGIVTFGSEAQRLFETLDVEAQDAAFRAVAEAIASRLNTSLEALLVHRDETATHAHFMLAGYDFDGVPMSQTMKRAALAEAQDVAAEVIREHVDGIERGTSKRSRLDAGARHSDTLNRSVAELHADLPSEIEKKRGELVQAQARVKEMERRVEETAGKARGEDDKAEKARKRLQKYENRLADRQADLDALNSKIQDLEARETAVSARELKADEREKALNVDRETMAREVAETTAKAITDVIVGDVHADGRGGWNVPKEDIPSLKPIWNVIEPIVSRLASWWQNFQHRAQELPAPPDFKNDDPSAE